jgi:hypothetical protein
MADYKENKLSEALQGIFDVIGNLTKELTVNLPEFKFPPIELPRIEFPKIEIDYDRIKKIATHNSQFGWTLTGEMGLGNYLNDDLLELSQTEVDEYFLSHYRYKSAENNLDFYKDAREAILETVNPKWVELIHDCFKCYDYGMFRVCIPNLLMVIEGEISDISESIKVGKPLISEFKKDFDTESEQFEAISLYSLVLFLEGSLFKTHWFTNSRLELINRNWVLHGRDDPSLWKEVDYFRLINVLSTLQFIKEMLRD